ncbi:PadR family transcriptional regulator [Sorangium sp. So ce315]|uniref:PadR family transcriptional regulator n=1 Tax=Sorangium sp. So ce315 TaxID=3133299 RepID=UPI003F61EAC2
MFSTADREIRLGLWKIHILHHAAAHEVWGLWLLEELAEHGHRLSPGTLYPALARMERHGWLEACEATQARGRRSYRATAAGRRLLAALKRDVTELYREVVLGREPRDRAAASREDHGAAARRPARGRKRTPSTRTGTK